MRSAERSDPPEASETAEASDTAETAVASQAQTAQAQAIVAAPSASASPSPSPAPRPKARRASRRWWQSPGTEAVRGWFALRLLPGSAQPRALPALAAVTAGFVAALVMALRLLVPRAVGIADQGEGTSLLCQLGLRNVRPWDSEQFTQAIFPRWAPYEWFGETCPGAGAGLPSSSQLGIGWLAQWMTPWFGGGEGLDTRVLGLLYCLLFGVLIAAFVLLLPGRLGYRLLIAGVLTLVTADGVFADFFVSPYAWPASMLGVLATMLALLYLWRSDTVDWMGLLVVTLVATFTLTSAFALASLLPVVVVALVWRPYRRRGARVSSSRDAPIGASSPGPPNRGMLRRLPGAVAALVLVGVVVVSVPAQSRIGESERRYDAVFLDILPISPDPRGDLEWFGLDPGLAEGAGRAASDPESALGQESFEQLAEKVTPATLALFAITHPERLLQKADRGLIAMTQPQLDYLGSYEADAGEVGGTGGPGTGADPWQKDSRVPLVRTLMIGFGFVPGALVLLQVAVFVLGIAVASRRRLGNAAVALGRMSVFAMAFLWLHFWFVLIEDGASELPRKLLTSTYLTMFAIPLGLALALLLAKQHPATQTVPKSSKRVPNPKNARTAASVLSEARPSP